MSFEVKVGSHGQKFPKRGNLLATWADDFVKDAEADVDQNSLRWFHKKRRYRPELSNRHVQVSK